MATAWREVTLESPSVLLALQLEYAKSVPLDVSATFSTHADSRKADWLLRHGERLGELTIVVDDTARDRIRVGQLMAEAQFRQLHVLEVQATIAGPVTFPPEDLPITLNSLSNLTRIRLSKVSMPMTAFLPCTRIRSLELDGGSFYERDYTIMLADLQRLLPSLPSLDDLVLRGSFDTRDRTLASIGLPSLTAITLHSQATEFEVFLEAFELPFVKSWRLVLRIGSTPLSSLARLRALTTKFLSAPNKIKLYWLSPIHTSIAMDNFTSDSSDSYDSSDSVFMLHLVVATSTSPSHALADLMGHNEAMVGVDTVWLHGGHRAGMVAPHGDDGDDGIMERMLCTLPRTRNVIVYGNGDIWGRVPVVLQGMQLSGRPTWMDVDCIKLQRVTFTPQVFDDWINYLTLRKDCGRQVELLILDRCVVVRIDAEKRLSLENSLSLLVTRVEGSLQSARVRFH